MEKYKRLHYNLHTTDMPFFHGRQYHAMAYNEKYQTGDNILLVEYDNTGRCTDIRTSEIEKIEVSWDKQQMILVLRPFDEVQMIFDKLRELEEEEHFVFNRGVF